MPPPPPTPSRTGWTWVIVAVFVVVAVGVGLSSSRSPSYLGADCPQADGGAILDVSGAVPMHEAGFVMEDDNCLWDPSPGFFIDFDGPAALNLAGPTQLGASDDVTFEMWTGEETIVVYSTELAENRGACSIQVDESTNDRVTGSFACSTLVGATYPGGTDLVRIPGADPPSIEVSGTFEFVRA